MTTDFNKNFLDENWWKTATPDDVMAEIKNGADVNAKGTLRDARPLILATKCHKNLQTIRMLIDNGADVNSKSYIDSTPLMFAQDIETVKILIEHGADVNNKNYLEETPLKYAKSPEIAEFLIKHGADVNFTDGLGHSLLMCIRNPKVSEVLIKNGADVNAKDIAGYIALDYAKGLANRKLAKILKSYGSEDRRPFWCKIFPLIEKNKYFLDRSIPW